MKFVNTSSDVLEKVCHKCSKLKSFDEFFKDSTSGDLHSRTCKLCKNNKKKVTSKTIFGLIKKIYHSQHTSSKARNLPIPTYTLDQLTEWIVFNPSFKDLYLNWVNSGYSKDMVPSIDRIDDYKGYSFENNQLMTWAENNEKGHTDRLSGKNLKNTKAIICLKRGKFFKEFNSIAQAERSLGLHHGLINNVLKGNFKQTNGYVFFYKNDINNSNFSLKSEYIKNNIGVIGTHKITGEILTFNSIKDAQFLLGIFNVSEVCNGNRKSSGGYLWEFKKEGGSY